VLSLFAWGDETMPPFTESDVSEPETAWNQANSDLECLMVIYDSFIVVSPERERRPEGAQPESFPDWFDAVAKTPASRFETLPRLAMAESFELSPAILMRLLMGPTKRGGADRALPQRR